MYILYDFFSFTWILVSGRASVWVLGLAICLIIYSRSYAVRLYRKINGVFGFYFNYRILIWFCVNLDMLRLYYFGRTVLELGKSSALRVFFFQVI